MMQRRSNRMVRAVQLLPSSRSRVVLGGSCWDYSTTTWLGASSSTESDPFVHPKAQELFHRITERLSAEDYHSMRQYMLDRLGVQNHSPIPFWRKRGKRGGGSGGSGGGGDEADANAAAPEKTAFDVTLTSFDAKAKIKIIKEIRGIADLGLKEAKELVDSAPKIIKKDLKKEQAEEIKAKLEALGAQIDIA